MFGFCFKHDGKSLESSGHGMDAQEHRLMHNSKSLFQLCGEWIVGVVRASDHLGNYCSS